VNKSEFKPYAKMNLGYSFNMNDGSYNYTVSGIQVDIDMNAKNGLYAAIGGGVEYKGYTADLSYQTNYSSLSADYSVAGTSLGSEDLGNMNFNRITLGLGYNFGL
ncbi:MAG: outer membrane insertion C- signal, partial [Leptotrichiaceae bacterium]